MGPLKCLWWGEGKDMGGQWVGQQVPEGAVAVCRAGVSVNGGRQWVGELVALLFLMFTPMWMETT